MELHEGRPSDYSPIDLTMCTFDEFARHARTYAEKYHSETIEKYQSRKVKDLTPHLFWDEYIWIVYTSGFNAKVVTKMYPRLLTLYADISTFQRARYQMEPYRADWSEVSKLIANRRKYDAIEKTRSEFQRLGWDAFKVEYLSSVDQLQKLPFVGGITKSHLGRNLGFDCVKPDLHLWRLTSHFKFKTPEDMCAYLVPGFGYRIGVVDFILWSYCAAFGTSEIHRELLL